MSITITNTTKELHMDYSTKPVVLDISYSGDIVGELHGNNNVVGMNKNRMIIAFTGETKNHFMSMTGGFKINNATAYGADKQLINVILKNSNDELQKIQSEWDSSTNKYEEYDRSSRLTRVKGSEITFNINGKKRTINNKGKILKQENINE